MPTASFNSRALKTLKDIFTFKSDVSILSGDTDDPTSVAKDAPASSLYLRAGTGELYIKGDSGSSTNWNLLSSAPATHSATLLESQTNTAVTGFIFDNTVRAFNATVIIDIQATTDAYYKYNLSGIRTETSGWVMQTADADGDADASTVTLSINSSTGQIEYTSSTYTGFSSGTIKFQYTTVPA